MTTMHPIHRRSTWPSARRLLRGLAAVTAVAALAAQLAVPAQAAAVARELAPGVQAWQSTIGTDNSQFELRGAAVSWTDDAAMLTVVRMPEGVRRVDGLLQAWSTRLDPRNASAADWSPAPRPEESLTGRRGARMAGTLVAATTDRRFFTLGADQVGIIRLARLDSAAEHVVNLDLAQVEMRGLRAHAPNRLLITGSTGTLPFAAEVDIDGRVLRKWVVRDLPGAVVVAQPTGDGDLVALIDTSSAAEPTLVVARIGADGAVRSRVDRNGVAMDLAVLRDGGVAVTYARSRVTSHEVRLLLLTAGVDAARSDAELLVSPTSPARFRLAAAPRGGLLVAGVRERGLWLARIDGAGQRVWDSWSDPRRTAELEMTLGIDLQADDRGRYMLAYSALIAEGRRQVQVVRALRFNLE